MRLLIIDIGVSNNGELVMSKSKDTKKETKKAPAKTMKEKKAEKKLKAEKNTLF